MNEQNVNRFIGFADTYENARPSVPDHFIDILTNYLGKKPELVVDLGCGTGLSTLVYARNKVKAIGIEPSADMLKEASKKSNEYLHFIKGNGENIPLEDESVEIVVCSQSFHWMEPQATLKEVNRILKPGGIFATIDYDWPGMMNLEAEIIFQDMRSYIRNIKEIDYSHTNGYRKDLHIPNMQKSGYFRYIREIVFSNVETYTPDKLISMILSQSSVQHALRQRPDLIIDRFKTFQEQILEIYQDEFPIEFGYRIRLGVKK